MQRYRELKPDSSIAQSHRDTVDDLNANREDYEKTHWYIFGDRFYHKYGMVTFEEYTDVLV